MELWVVGITVLLVLASVALLRGVAALGSSS
jgi:hypothetical protein